MALGFRSRQSLLNYRGRQEFAGIIERARLTVENYAEERLFDRNGYTGAAWLLSTAFGWGRDATDVKTPLPVVHTIMDAGV